jgi:protein phosphatase methylesterase 1
MSTRFLDITLPKLLVLAGVDRLDTLLTIGQMQGKFQVLMYLLIRFFSSDSFFACF